MGALPSCLCCKSHYISYVLHCIMMMWLVELGEKKCDFRNLDIWVEARCDIIVSALAHFDDDGKGLVRYSGVCGVDLVTCSWLLAGLYTGSWATMCVSYMGPKYHYVHIYLCVYWTTKKEKKRVINDQKLTTRLILVVNIVLLTTKYKSCHYKINFNDGLNKSSWINHFLIVTD